MSGSPRVKLMNPTESEARPVLGPAGNKARSIELWKPVVKPKSEKAQRLQGAEVTKGKRSPVALQSEMDLEKRPSSVGLRKTVSSAATILRQQPNFSLNASCSSDASSDSSHSRASTGRINRRIGTPTTPSKTKQKCSPDGENVESKEGQGNNDGSLKEAVVAVDSAVVKKRCAWVTSNTDPVYAAFHDEEWGFPVHDDRKLFELLSLCTALAELSWPIILSKRRTFRDVFLDFDPVAVSTLNEKKTATPGSSASSLLSELKLRAIIENARQICKIVDEVGSFDKYIWGFVNYKPIVGNFRYPRQVPIKTSKAETISKDLVRRGFRGVGPTVMYSFMQVAGITNDHLFSCFRHQDCITAGKNENIASKNDSRPTEDVVESELIKNIDDLSLSR